MEKRKRNSAHLVFIMATLEKFFTEKKQFHPKVHLAVTFSKIQLGICHLHIFHNAIMHLKSVPNILHKHCF